MATTMKGDCYICGMIFSKTAMKNHILKQHAGAGASAGTPCRLLKVEGAYAKDYWLYLEIPDSSTLKTLDEFLRRIWLECCGHLSAYRLPGREYEEIPMNRKISDFVTGDKLVHEYDFGSTTECLITVMGETVRTGKKRGVHLLARNIPPQFTCRNCGKPATWIDTESMYEDEDPFLCDACAHGDDEMVDEEMLLPVTNSPRMGVCGYCGDYDKFSFVRPEILKGIKI